MTVLGIGSNIATGVTLTQERAERLVAEALEKGLPHATVGSPIKVPEGDPRAIEYRILPKKGKPGQVEISIVTRDAAGKPKEPKSLKVEWPFLGAKKPGKGK
jgi:hypothetical protein